MKTDKNTNRKYFDNNIPADRIYTIESATGKKFRIFSEDGTNAAWYNGEFLGDRYAVFTWTGHFWQQCSNWYIRYGNAVNYMLRTANTLQRV